MATFKDSSGVNSRFFRAGGGVSTGGDKSEDEEELNRKPWLMAERRGLLMATFGCACRKEIVVLLIAATRNIFEKGII